MPWVLLDRPVFTWRYVFRKSTKTAIDVACNLINSKSLDRVLFFTEYDSQFAVTFATKISDDLKSSSLYIYIYCQSIRYGVATMQFNELKNNCANQLLEGCQLLLTSEVHNL